MTPALRASYLVFAACGLLISAWVARIPQLRDHLHLSSAQLGWVLLAGAAGSLLARPLSSPILTRLGQARTVAVFGGLGAVALVVTGLGDVAGVWVLVTGLLLIGVTVSVWDVAMNVQAAEVERRAARSVMPRCHAAFAAGTVVGAGSAAAMVALRVPVATHLTVVALVTAAVVLPATRDFVPSAATPASASSLRAWREPRTLLIGLFVLTFAFAEGAAGDWLGVALIDGHSAAPAIATLGYALYLSATTATRWFGGRLLDRFGRVAVLRALGTVTILGLLLFILAPNVPLALTGAALWGIGTAFGYPVGMSAGADDPSHAAARVTAISTLGKLATFTGPPLIGLLADHTTILRALLVVAALQALAFLLAPATRPLSQVSVS